MDISAEQLAALRGAIASYIGSKPPDQIAISVMAEVIARKNGLSLPASVTVAHAKAQLAQQVA